MIQNIDIQTELAERNNLTEIDLNVWIRSPDNGVLYQYTPMGFLPISKWVDDVYKDRHNVSSKKFWKGYWTGICVGIVSEILSACILFHLI